MVTIKLVGRLGNQMFQYSICRLVAELKGYNFYISSEKSEHGQNISEYFNLNMGKIDGNIKYNFWEGSQDFNSKVFDIPDYTSILGYFQSEKYYFGNENRIKNWFELKIDDETDRLLSKYNVEDYCYIHFRGTDYLNHTHWYLPKKYYEDAINKIKAIKSNIKFLVITDDIKTASLSFDCDIISNDMMIDFKLLSFSKYSIIVNSSFSWWSGWLGDNHEYIIAPNYWFNYNNPHMGFDPKDIYTSKFIYI